MITNIFQTAVALSDADLLVRTHGFAQTERQATAELVAHLAHEGELVFGPRSEGNATESAAP